jgi:hypothetical protein
MSLGSTGRPTKPAIRFVARTKIRMALIFTLALSLPLPLPHAFDVAEATAAVPKRQAWPSEGKIWITNPQLRLIAERMNPLGKKAGDGALGLNVKFPNNQLVAHQVEGFQFIRSGLATKNGFVMDRGIMAFEWSFAKMKSDGSFGESKTIEITHFLGLFARSVYLLRAGGQEARAQRLERLKPRLELSLKSSRSLLGERRWDQAERNSWQTPQRLQAAAAAFWIGKFLANPTLRQTSDAWLREALVRQRTDGWFPSPLPENSAAAARSQSEAIDVLIGLALADPSFGALIREPLGRAMQWLLRHKHHRTQKLSTLALAQYAALAEAGLPAAAESAAQAKKAARAALSTSPKKR